MSRAAQKSDKSECQIRELTPETRVSVRNRLRDNRLAALANAEDFVGIVQTLEELGQLLCGEQRNGFGMYEYELRKFAQSNSVLPEVYARHSPQIHSNLEQLLTFVRKGRNDSVHSGVFARKVVSHAIDLSIVLEDALMADGAVAEFMVRNVIIAKPWQPLSFIRRQMLEHSFSYLPIYQEAGWRLLSDAELVRYLRVDPTKRRGRLSETVEAATKSSGDLKLIENVQICQSHEKIEKILDRFTTQPALVIEPGAPSSLIGIVTAFDLL